MSNEKCPGCGAYLQSQEPDKLGFVPKHRSSEKAVICQRCYRISHYGKDELGAVSRQQALAAVKEGVDSSDAVILIIDLMDFEGSLPHNLLRYLTGKPGIAALNKGDLLPPKTTFAETQRWAQKQLKQYKLQLESLAISAITGEGLGDLERKLKTNDYGQISVVGATNVGKSTLIRRILSRFQVKGPVPTVSRFPGTTIDRTQWQITANMSLVDTPGIVPEGRLSDLVCSDCANKLIADQKLKPVVYPAKEGLALVIPGLAAIECIAPSEPGIISGFTASEVRWQRTNSSQVAKWLDKSCGKCQLAEFVQHTVLVKGNHDLHIHGLGWISVRKRDLELSLTLPRGIDYSLRPNLVGPKKPG